MYAIKTKMDKTTPLPKPGSANENNDEDPKQLQHLLVEFQKQQLQILREQQELSKRLTEEKQQVSNRLEKRLEHIEELLLKNGGSDFASDTANKGKSKTRSTSLNAKHEAISVDNTTGDDHNTQDEPNASTTPISKECKLALAKLDEKPKKWWGQLWKDVYFLESKEDAITYVSCSAPVPIHPIRTRGRDQSASYFQCVKKECGYQMRVYYDRKIRRWFVAETEDKKVACQKQWEESKATKMKSHQDIRSPNGGQGTGIKEVKDRTGDQRGVDPRLQPKIRELKEIYPTWGGTAICAELKRLWDEDSSVFDSGDLKLTEKMLPDKRQIQVSSTHMQFLCITDIS